MITEVKGSRNEPFVELPDFKTLKGFSHEEFVTMNQQRRQKQKFEFYLNIFDFLKESEIDGHYFEFGVHKARTFRFALAAAELYKIKNMEFHAFDSFEGLPNLGHTLVKNWGAGALQTTEDEFLKLINSYTGSLEKVYTHPGFYEDSLNEEKAAELFGKKCSFICIDCDYYESAVPIFNFIEPYIQHGTVIYLDDIFAGFKKESSGGTGKAFDEYIKKSTFNFRQHVSIGWWGQSWIAEEKQ